MKKLIKKQRDITRLTRLNELLEHGFSMPDCAVPLGVSQATVYRLATRLREAGGDIEAAARGKRCGRPPVAELTDEEARAVRELILGGQSEVTALRMKCRDGTIRAEVAAVVMNRKNKHDIPASIRRQIKVCESAIMYNNSPREMRLKKISTPRKNVRVVDGEEVPDTPGDAFVFDDMTANFAYWTPWPFGDSESSKRHGVKVTRGQLLAAMDLASMKFIHFDLIVRNGESYQTNDIWAEYGRIFKTIGMPRNEIIHEGGHWEGRQIHGQKVTGPDAEMRIGGLQALGITATRSWTPKTKPIEGRFDFLQNLMEGLPGNLGRAREGGKEWKIFNKCAAGTLDAREYLPSQSQIADKIMEIMMFANGEPLGGRQRGTPNDLWDAAMAARPLQKLNPTMGWVFARDSRHLTLPSKPPIKCRFQRTDGGRDLYFDDPCLLLIPHKKLKVMIHFDPLETEGEAVVVNSDLRSFDLPAHSGQARRTIRPGDVICVARRVHESARINPAGDSNLRLTKEKVNVVRTEVRSILGGKQRPVRMAEAYNGFGDAARLQQGGGGHAAAMPEMSAPVRRAPAITPARSSRGLPAGVSRADEIARLKAQLEEAEA